MCAGYGVCEGVSKWSLLVYSQDTYTHNFLKSQTPHTIYAHTTHTQSHPHIHTHTIYHTSHTNNHTHKTHTLHSRSLLLSMLWSLVLAPHNSLSFLPVVKVTSSECCTHSQSLLQVHQALCIVAAKVSQTQPTPAQPHIHTNTPPHTPHLYTCLPTYTHPHPCTPLQVK